MVGIVSVHDRSRVAGGRIREVLLRSGGEPVGIDIPHLRHPALDVLGLRIVLLGLGVGVVDAEPVVGTHRGGPLPVAGVHGGIVVGERPRKMLCAPAPVHEQVFREKAGDDHSHPVVHVAGFAELAHAGIDEGHARGPRVPPVELAPLVAPRDVPADRAQRGGQLLGAVEEEMCIEVPPVELAD